MGFFDNYNEIEEELLATYSNEFSIMGLPDAKKTAKSFLDAAIVWEGKRGQAPF